MPQRIDLRVRPEEATDEQILRKHVARQTKTDPTDIHTIIIRRRSIDARQRQVYVNLGLEVYSGSESPVEDDFSDLIYPSVEGKTAVIVVGAGPAGLFAALRLIELGLRPIILERGKSVHERRADIARIPKEGHVDPESNYGFGEGGAGAFSDGKLYTRSKKRGDITKILRILCKHGAQPSILIDAHPHIGTDRLPKVIENIRHQILAAGGEVHFSCRMESLIIHNGQVVGARDNEGREYCGPVILATGHSARDIYRYLHRNGIRMEAKGTAVGVRLEHPQALIDQLRYHNPKGRGLYLPPAEYTYTAQVEGRGVYSFCMCPGGFVVPASTAPDQTVVNGMSPANRGSRWANSGLVVEIHPEDVLSTPTNDPLALMNWIERLEGESWTQARCSLRAPAQRMTDFLSGRSSVDLPKSSYNMGLTPSRLDEWLPSFITKRIQKAFQLFDRQTKGFLTAEAQLIALESRTSSPVRILRESTSCEHPLLRGLFPCGEGAGYAGGIVSAAMDGERCAEGVASYLG
ncbi:NAD(P)/FAD-dependent oxidoreductase [Porphyromonas gingivalis]|uniref:NAD(P)/FAD-dependent oxidoreductase n=1 Tax=Porphyromonas gingivalis TaxID=837 RepID=UPI000BE76052|nr:FAD-binding protein [Porphyromonas gingivalis]MCE8191215.1 FAD-binding protein [Porphyromonas gingivalis]PDP72952.1 FAD-binding protein [Porphyromonas gingivalis]QUI90334.1 FAD-binding protein [Porphyromonas gingivalis]QUI92281.1 FAD-binding protein [Porphyromonas gingivalis]